MKKDEVRPGELCRSLQRPIIKKQRLRFFRSLVGEEGVSQIQNFELSKREYIVIAIVSQVNLNTIIHYLNHVMQFEGIFVSLAYMFMQIVLGMPLFHLYTFMSSYSKKSYVTFWHCVPILEGLGLTIAIINFTSELFSVTAAGLSMVLMTYVFNGRVNEQLRTCNNGSARNVCIPMYPKEALSQKCPSKLIRKKETTYFVSTQYFLRHTVMGYDQFNLSCCKINVNWTISVFFTWILIFFIVILGVKRIRTLSINLQLVFTITVFYISVIILLKTESFRQEFDLHSVYKALSQFGFWLDTMQSTAEMSIFGNVLWLGAIKPKSLTSRSAAIIVSFFKLLILVTTLCWSTRVVQRIIVHYKIADPNCLVVTGFDLMFSFVPDLLHRISLGKFLVLQWYVSIFFFGIITPIYTIIGVVDSLSQKYSILNKYRLYFYLALCVTGSLLSLCVTHNLSLSLTNTFKNYGLMLLNSLLLLVITLALMFIYSSKRIVDDYNFTYGSPPHKYWCISWKTIPIVAIFGVIMMFSQIKTDGTKSYTNLRMIILSYVIALLMMLPIVVQFLTKCCRHVKYRTLSSLTRPSHRWGPHNLTQKQLRKYFYPQRDIKYRNYVLKCTHRCITNSDEYFNENRRQKVKLLELVNEMNRRKLGFVISELLLK